MKRRIEFIDNLRSYAILMMIQGHTIDLVLNPIYRDRENSLYFAWNFMRGITAPVFFFASGLIYSYLLFRDNKRMNDNHRLKKGFRRGVFLLFIGYLLHFKVGLFIGKDITSNINYLLAVDVLHIIGLGLIFINFQYLISLGKKKFSLILLIISSFLSFFSYPIIDNLQTDLPVFITNYLNKTNGSNFVLLPWVGFSFLGAAGGIYLEKIRSFNVYKVTGIVLFIGITFHKYSSLMLLGIFNLTGLDVFEYLYHNNFVLYRLGQVFIIVGITYFLSEKANIPQLFGKIGSKTLSIYVLHSFLLYSAIFGIGLSSFVKYRLAPIPSIIIAIIHLIVVVLYVVYIDKIKNILPSFKKY